jgi:hypothetical protein
MSLHDAILRGLDFLRHQQTADGYWADWQLPPGESTTWTTAYVGARVSTLAPALRTSIDANLSRAQHWLRMAEFAAGGWGYAPNTEPDADSTALATLFLGEAAGEQRLLKYQRPDGGFATYSHAASYGSWVESHADVTATVLLALAQAPFTTQTAITQAVAYLRLQQGAGGLWNSFWWTSPLYATEATLASFDASGEPLDRSVLETTLRQASTGSPFERALLLMCLTRIRGDDRYASQHAETLVHEQMPDGSWQSGPILRLTSRAIRDPWRVADAGPLYRDVRRVFTTATAVAALGAFDTRVRESPGTAVAKCL